MKTFLNWSSGKDAALALLYLQQSEKYNVKRLLTTVNKDKDRVRMQGVRISLLKAQIEAVKLPCTIVELPGRPNMEVYESIVNKEFRVLKEQGFSMAAFGDIYLEDIRTYREQQLSKMGMEAVFPLWKKDTKELMYEFIELGFKAIVIVVQEDKLDPGYLGREVDRAFLKDLPEDIDPCGENGEFHTFCYDGPVFDHPVNVQTAERFYETFDAPEGQSKDPLGFWFCDLLAVG